MLREAMREKGGKKIKVWKEWKKGRAETITTITLQSREEGGRKGDGNDYRIFK
jgi:hypothetical protein